MPYVRPVVPLPLLRPRVTTPSLLFTTAYLSPSSLMPSSSPPLRSSSSSARKPVLAKSTINQHVINVQYAVRGELSIRANDYATRLRSGDKRGLPFDSVVTANIGNPQQEGLEQEPLTFWRQVAALTELPSLVKSISEPLLSSLFPSDVQRRAKDLLDDLYSVGAYSHSKGAASIRKHVAEFIEERDGHPADPERIYLTSGASGGVALLFQIMLASPSSAVLIPIPQYPLYTATLALHDAHALPYYLNESSGDWALDVPSIRQSIRQARSEGKDVSSMVVINPGNPTGATLSEENMREVVLLAHEERLVLLADEVYQRNIYQPEQRPFVSFKKVLRDFALPQHGGRTDVANGVELVSFHSISKGVTGECGRRGGYFELVNIDAEVEEQVYKLASIQLCPSVQGQIGVDLLVRPPREGEPSYALYKQEEERIHLRMKERVTKMRDAFLQMEGVDCNEAQGAMYLFPRIRLPRRAIEAAQKAGKKPDDFYCLELLDATGICVVPGSGFGQVEGTYHFRTTILAKETDAFVERISKFHKQFMDKYRD